jgi:hypothetical protein
MCVGVGGLGGCFLLLHPPISLIQVTKYSYSVHDDPLADIEQTLVPCPYYKLKVDSDTDVFEV